MGFTSVSGIDFTLPSAPPLTAPPLSLPELAILLLDTQGQVEQLRVANEKAASAAQQLSDITYDAGAEHPDFDAASTPTPGEVNDEGRDLPGQADSVADARRALVQLQSEYDSAVAFRDDLAARVAELSRWEHGLVYLPELSNAASTSLFAPDSGTPVTDGALKPDANNQAPGSNPFFWYDPFVAVALDDRSLFGYPNTDFESRALRARRALVGHEAWQVESEFWSGATIPTNYHLSASPNTPTTSPHRTIDAWPNPTPAPGTVLGTAYGLAQSMAALDQAIAESDAGTGMIHATPYVMQEWMKLYPFIRDPDGKVYTVNHNLLVPGFGYGGTGPDQATRSETDGSGTGAATGFTSASAAFTAYDVGRPITETSAYGVIPAGTYILSVTNGTTVVLSQPCGATHTGVHFTVAGQGGRAGGSPQQWAYATEQVYTLRGDIVTYPYDLREGAPLVTLDNSVAVRAERSWGCLTNRLLRAAILIDTTTP